MFTTAVVHVADGALDVLLYASCNDCSQAPDTAFAGTRARFHVGGVRPSTASRRARHQYTERPVDTLSMSAPRSESDLLLSGPLTVETVQAAQQKMAAHVAGAVDVVVRAAEVTQLDGAGAQLLCAFVTAVTRGGREVRWASASIYLAEAAALLGMSDHLGLSGLPAEVTSWRP